MMDKTLLTHVILYHSLFDLKVHVAWITKYRKPVLLGEVGQRLRDIIWRIC